MTPSHEQNGAQDKASLAREDKFFLTRKAVTLPALAALTAA
jgi:hypothetical protein